MEPQKTLSRQTILSKKIKAKGIKISDENIQQSYSKQKNMVLALKTTHTHTHTHTHSKGTK
jgi:hypothetical protein